MGDTYYECCDCGREDVVNAVEGVDDGCFFCEGCYYDRVNMELELDKAKDTIFKLKERIDFLEGYIKSSKDAEVDAVLGGVR